MNQKGFTLIELIVVTAILGILSSTILVSLNQSRERAYYSSALAEMRSIATAIEIYGLNNSGFYPADVQRDIAPAGLSQYLAGQGLGGWPRPKWPGSFFDWENWTDPVSGVPIRQVSVRFCPNGGNLSSCNFPNEPWAASFNVDSALYFCLEGPCRSHISQPITYPGKCVNC